ncbi:hypothetical protein GCM10012287_16370 [Streptomyces daqingensis]|uniref:CBM6 domain-containing protein n=1 Tax=Streptomyces daqingensis TaxID=1472640 RepID=A0ABQ2M357_9ACTN|nr:CBM35 domain-containing protein [Streptomyces daqingensis]GGO46327.1 hypothetical protein GCM10012287_16370 [Streptomyces daqingensis]
MTAENEGAGQTPEADDPFGYLYRQQGGDGSTAPQPGTPRRSYNQVRTVGERQYGGPRTQGAGYGQQPNAHYAAPETMAGGRAVTQQHPVQSEGNGHRGARAAGGRSRNGLLIGAIAVVAAVVVGIGAAIYFNSGSSEKADTGGPAAGTGDDEGPKQDEPEDEKLSKGQLVGRKQDAASLALGGGAAAANDVPNAQGKNGNYVGAMNNPGAAATWTTEVPESGAYTLFVRFGVPGEDADSTLTVNGQAQQKPLSMKNFAQAKKGEWDKGWTRTWAWVDLKEGRNTFKISCEPGNKCNFNLDQMWLKAGQVKQ